MFRERIIDWVEFGGCLCPTVSALRLPPLVMLGLHCDESDDGTTYALAGWIAAPQGWNHFQPLWRQMLNTIIMPDGSSMQSFHAVDLLERDNVSDSKFKGWTFQQEVEVFTKAIDAIECEAKSGWIKRIGVSFHIPREYSWLIEREVSAWVILFGRLQMLLLQRFGLEQFSLVFDSKPEVRAPVNAFMDRVDAGLRLSGIEPFIWYPITFAPDEKALPLQAADLLAYEWRKRSSDIVLNPTKPPRKSYQRLSAATAGHMVHYGPSDIVEILTRFRSGEPMGEIMRACDGTED